MGNYSYLVGVAPSTLYFEFSALPKASQDFCRVIFENLPADPQQVTLYDLYKSLLSGFRLFGYGVKMFKPWVRLMHAIMAQNPKTPTMEFHFVEHDWAHVFRLRYHEQDVTLLVSEAADPAAFQYANGDGETWSQAEFQALPEEERDEDARLELDFEHYKKNYKSMKWKQESLEE